MTITSREYKCLFDSQRFLNLEETLPELEADLGARHPVGRQLQALPLARGKRRALELRRDALLDHPFDIDLVKTLAKNHHVAKTGRDFRPPGRVQEARFDPPGLGGETVVRCCPQQRPGAGRPGRRGLPAVLGQPGEHAEPMDAPMDARDAAHGDLPSFSAEACQVAVVMLTRCRVDRIRRDGQ